MPTDVEGQRRQRASQNAARVSKKAKEAERRKRKAAEKKAQKKATKAKAGRQPKAKAPLSDDESMPENVADANPFQADNTSKPATASKQHRKHKKQHLTDDEDSDDEDTPSRLHPDDPDNFIKLCTALQLLLGREIDESDLNMADVLLREYCAELIEVGSHYPVSHE